MNEKSVKAAKEGSRVRDAREDVSRKNTKTKTGIGSRSRCRIKDKGADARE